MKSRIRKTTPVYISALSTALILFGSHQSALGQQQSQTNWEQLCISYGGLVGIHTPCDQLAHGTELTQHGKIAIYCLMGGGMLTLLGVDQLTLKALANTVRCP